MKQIIYTWLAMFLVLTTACSEQDEVPTITESNLLILDWNNLAYTVGSDGYKKPLLYEPMCSYVVYKVEDEEKLFAKLRGMGLTVNENWVGGEDLDWNTGIYANTRRLYRVDGIIPSELNAMDEVVYASYLAFYCGHVLPEVEAVTIVAGSHADDLKKLASFCRVECIPMENNGTTHLCLLTKVSTVNNVEFIHLCKDNGMDFVLQPYINKLYPSNPSSWVHSPVIYGGYTIPEWAFEPYQWYYDKLQTWDIPLWL